MYNFLQEIEKPLKSHDQLHTKKGKRATLLIFLEAEGVLGEIIGELQLQIAILQQPLCLSLFHKCRQTRTARQSQPIWRKVKAEHLLI